LLRAAKSRTKTEDPEKEKLKAKAKELQRIEEDQLRYEKANNTALMAIGGPKKKIRLDESAATSVAVSNAFGVKSASMAARPRTKRVHLRDLMFLMEQEKELKRSPLLWKAYSS
jgi:transcription initiation factor TFIID subunit 4